MTSLLLPEHYFKALSDETRLRCLMLIYAAGELCVCELTAALELSQPKISRHLAQLRQIGLLVDSRSSHWVYYKINPALPAWASAVLATTVQANAEMVIYQQDRHRLHTLSHSVKNNCA